MDTLAGIHGGSSGAWGILSTSMSDPDVSFLVVTRNRRTSLRRCLASIDRQVGVRTEIVVVDNGSEDGTPERLADERPDVRLVALDRNAGASGGRNRGLAAARGAIVITVDDDAELVGSEIARRCVERFGEDDRCGVISFKILEPASGLEERKSIPRRDKRRIDGDYATTYFCTAGCAFRAAALPDGEVFWERLVIYGEELDLAYRILNDGWGMVRANDLVVVHHETPQARPPDRFYYRMFRNRLSIAIRNLPAPAVATHVVVWSVRMALSALRAGALPAFSRGLVDSLRDVRAALTLRAPLGPEAIARLRADSGRLWF
jgi:GT2 family glycosyltransferase